jgi:hypothetical protein
MIEPPVHGNSFCEGWTANGVFDSARHLEQRGTDDPTVADGRSGGDLRSRKRSLDDGASNVDESEVLVARVAPERHEGLVHADARVLGHDSLRLLDENSARQRVLQLLGEELVLLRGPVLEDPDGRDIGERLRGDEVTRGEPVRVCPEQVQRPDHLRA